MDTPRLTEAAAARVRVIAARQGKAEARLRLAVEGGGCAGFTYRFALADAGEKGDTVADTQGVQLLVDPDSLPFVAGAEVDYVEKLGQAHFEVRNPQAASGCGCGSSFSV
jgi:iron-sulfur cluster assembly accessory protein